MELHRAKMFCAFTEAYNFEYLRLLLYVDKNIDLNLCVFHQDWLWIFDESSVMSLQEICHKSRVCTELFRWVIKSLKLANIPFNIFILILRIRANVLAGIRICMKGQETTI